MTGTKPHQPPVKLLVFAHVPPPHHGQSYMVQLMLRGFENRADELQVWHVDARFSTDVDDIGGFRLAKAFSVFRYVFQALQLRFRHGITHFYYVPAPGMTMPVLRDWVVMACCRPFFRRLILHWHSVGLGEWLETSSRRWLRPFTHLALGHADVSVVLSRYNAADAERFRPRKIDVVANGIPDPCPRFAERTLALRQERLQHRRRVLAVEASAGEPSSTAESEGVIIRVLFLALCTRDKGLFEAVDGVLMANQHLRSQNRRVRFVLTIAGKFYTPQDEMDLNQRLAQPNAAGAVVYKGFVSGNEKAELLANSDLFCFPTYYGMEGQPVNLIEAMAYGLSIVASEWRSIPEMLPEGHPGLVPPRSAEAVAAALRAVALRDEAAAMRARFEARYSLDTYIKTLANSIRNAGSPASGSDPDPSGPPV